MQVYADYAFYRERYLGRSVSEEDFPHLALRVSAYLDRLTFSRAQSAQGEEAERVGLACCAAAEVLARADRGELASETVDKWSRSYRGDGKSVGKRLYDAVAPFLGQLLYRGVGP